MNRTMIFAAACLAVAALFCATWFFLGQGGNDQSPLPTGAGSLSSRADRAPFPPPGDAGGGGTLPETVLIPPASVPDPDGGAEGSASLTVRVIAEADRSPVAGAEVSLTSAKDERRAVAGTDGAVRFEALGSGEYALRAAAAGFADATEAIGLAAAGEARETTIALKIGAALAGMVVDRSDGTPIEGVRVNYFHPVLTTHRSATTDAAGRFRIAGLTPGAAPHIDNLRWGRTGYFRIEQLDGGRCVESSPGLFTVELSLVKAASAAGRVLDAGGQPAAGARVFAYDCAYRSSRCRAATWDFERTGTYGGIDCYEACAALADEQGRFTLPAVPPEIAVRIAAIVTGEAFVETDERIFAPGEAAAGIILAAARGSRLSGETVDEKGAPVPGAAVDIYTARGRSTTGDLRLAAGMETNESGGFACTGLEPGTYIVRAYKYGFASADDVQVDLKAEAAAHLRITLDARASAITGRIIDSAGRPVSGVTVTCIPSAMPDDKTMVPGNARSGEDGAFRVAGLWKGILHLVNAADPQGAYVVQRRGPALVMPGTDGLEMTAVRAATVAGRVEGLPEGTEGTVKLTGVGGSTGGGFTTAGLFRIVRVLPATYDVVIKGSGLTEKTVGRITVDEGAVLEDLVFYYGATTAVSGAVVRAADRAPVAGICVTLFDPVRHASGAAPVPGTGKMMEVLADGAGRFRFAGVAPGTYAITAWDPLFGGGTTRNVTVLPEEELAGLVVAVQEGAPVSGHVELEGGRRLESAVILQLCDSDKVMRLQPTQRDGSFALRLAPGLYAAGFEAPGGRSGMQRISVPQQGLEGIVLYAGD